ncbi:hypothetical protein L7F22_041427, partial [Adiantum nelumboides]|nr:hypothetical protein [Adiantum nelumboides]
MPTRKCAAAKPYKPEKGKKLRTMDVAFPLKGTRSPQSISTPNTRASKGSISMDQSAKSIASSTENENTIAASDR